jgi:hypothetical protein
MPYLDEAAFNSPAGELNRAITKLLVKYVHDQKPRYETFNDVMGALEAAKAEFYRRVVAPYEDKKIVENGDIYG